MRSAIKAALSLSVGSTALILSGVAFGQATGVGTINFGQFPIDAQCDATSGPGVTGTCKVLAAGTGFIQRQFAIDTPSGQRTFIQTVIDDGKGFKSEDYVGLASGTQAQPGISSKLLIEPLGANAGDVFSTGSVIKSGWAAISAADPNGSKTVADITLKVGSDDPAIPGNKFLSEFAVSTTFDKSAPANTNPNEISNLRVDQSVFLGSLDQKQVFATQIKKAGADSGPLKFAGDPTEGPGTSWTQGQMIQATYVGQAVNVGTTDNPAIARFSSETASNLAAVTATFATNLNSATPTYWSETGPGAMKAEFQPLPTFLP